MFARSSLSIVLVGLGIGCLLLSSVSVGGSSDVGYAHQVELATNDSLVNELGYRDSDIVTYESLSKRGQSVFDRARSDFPYVIENESGAAPDFDYTSDNVAIGHGAYPIHYSEKLYSLQTSRRSAGFNAAVWLFSLISDGARIVGLILVTGGTLFAGWRRYRKRS